MNFTIKIDDLIEVSGEFEAPADLYPAIVRNVTHHLDKILPIKTLNPAPDILYSRGSFIVVRWGMYIGKVKSKVYETLYGPIDMDSAAFPRDSQARVLEVCQKGRVVDIFAGDTANWVKSARVTNAWPFGVEFISAGGSQIVMRIEDIVQVRECTISNT